MVDDPKAKLGFPEVKLGLLPGAGGVVRTVRMFGIVDALMGLLMQGQELRAGEGAGDGSRRRGRGEPRGADPGGEGVDRGAAQASRAPAVGREGLQDPRRRAVEPEARAEPAGVPGEPAQAAEGRELSGAAPHHGGGGGGRAGRLRHGDRDRGPLLHRPGDGPGVEEHDPGVLLRPAAGQRRARSPAGHRALRLQEGGRARRGHDGRGDRLRVRQSGHRGGAQGRLAGGCGEGPAPTRRRCSRRRSRAVARPSSRPTSCWRGSRRQTTRRRRRARTW